MRRCPPFRTAVWHARGAHAILSSFSLTPSAVSPRSSLSVEIFLFAFELLIFFLPTYLLHLLLHRFALSHVHTSSFHHPTPPGPVNRPGRPRYPLRTPLLFACSTFACRPMTHRLPPTRPQLSYHPTSTFIRRSELSLSRTALPSTPFSFRPTSLRASPLTLHVFTHAALHRSLSLLLTHTLHSLSSRGPPTVPTLPLTSLIPLRFYWY